MADRCFSRRHFIGSKPDDALALDSFLRYCFDVSHERDAATGKLCRGVFYRSDRRIAAEYGIGRNRSARMIKTLQAMGWLEPVNKGAKRKPSGHFASTLYRVLSHDEWVTKYGTDRCKFTPDIEARMGKHQSSHVEPGQSSHVEPGGASHVEPGQSSHVEPKLEGVLEGKQEKRARDLPEPSLLKPYEPSASDFYRMVANSAIPCPTAKDFYDAVAGKGSPDKPEPQSYVPLAVPALMSAGRSGANLIGWRTA